MDRQRPFLADYIANSASRGDTGGGSRGRSGTPEEIAAQLARTAFLNHPFAYLQLGAEETQGSRTTGAPLVPPSTQGPISIAPPPTPDVGDLWDYWEGNPYTTMSGLFGSVPVSNEQKVRSRKRGT